MGAVAKHGLLLILLLVLFGILTAVVLGAVWLVVRAPQLLILGGVLLVGCWMLGALASTIGSRRQ
jgi:hypothetical protein